MINNFIPDFSFCQYNHGVILAQASAFSYIKAE